MADRGKAIEDLLIKRGLITAEQFEHVKNRAAQENTSIESIIEHERLVFPEALAQVRAEIVGIPYIDLSKAQIDNEAMRDISRKAALTYRFIAFDIREKKILIAMERPDNFQALEAVKFIARRRRLIPEIYLASPKGINDILGGSSAVEVEIGGALKEFSQELQAAGQVKGKKGRDIERIMEEAPVTKVVAVMIRHAIEGHASDIHIEPTNKELRVRYRIDGKLHTTLILPIKVHTAVISRIKILSNLKIDESRLPQDGRFSAVIEDRAYDFRVSTMPTTYGEKAALRILDKSTGAPTFDELGLRGNMKDVYKKTLRIPHGIILISGPTGSGKSTTLFTSLSMLNRPDINIVTLEDPVEYEIEGVNQTQVHPEIGLEFASGLRNILRQDPDVIMVGEIRDRETAEMAVHSALTGHLVLSTIHTNSAIGTIPRLIDMGIDSFLLAASLRLLMAQRLVGKLCQKCVKEVPLSETMTKRIAKEFEHIPELYIQDENQRNPHIVYQSDGCDACQDTGTVGRTGIFEVSPITRELRSVMNESAEYDTLQDIARKNGMITMRQDGLLKALVGEVRLEDVLRATAETKE